MRRSLGCIGRRLTGHGRKAKWKGAMASSSSGDGPIARHDARLFILGSLPGDASLKQQRYYAHPTNQFWRLLGEAIGEPLDAMDINAAGTAGGARIGLWDVVASAERAEASTGRSARRGIIRSSAPRRLSGAASSRFQCGTAAKKAANCWARRAELS